MSEEKKTQSGEDLEAKEPETLDPATEAETSEESEAAEAAEEEKKVENLEKDLEREESKDGEKYMRLMAEFQNYKKRTAKKEADIRSYANEKIITELLGVLDNFERALSSEVISDDFSSYVDGMKLIFQQLKTVLEKAGVKEIKAEGEEFNPIMHHAVMSVEDPELSGGIVKQVLQKGYELNGKVIRPAMVVVTK